MSESLLPGSISFAIRSLADEEFVLKTIVSKTKNEDKASEIKKIKRL